MSLQTLFHYCKTICAQYGCCVFLEILQTAAPSKSKTHGTEEVDNLIRLGTERSMVKRRPVLNLSRVSTVRRWRDLCRDCLRQAAENNYCAPRSSSMSSTATGRRSQNSGLETSHNRLPVSQKKLSCKGVAVVRVNETRPIPRPPTDTPDFQSPAKQTPATRPVVPRRSPADLFNEIVRLRSRNAVRERTRVISALNLEPLNAGFPRPRHAVRRGRDGSREIRR